MWGRESFSGALRKNKDMNLDPSVGVKTANIDMHAIIPGVEAETGSSVHWPTIPGELVSSGFSERSYSEYKEENS